MPVFVEYSEQPLAIGTDRPLFSWHVPLAGRGRRQSAYQVLVASDRALIRSGSADVWDSGKVDSSQSVNVTYAGKPLRSNADYFWAFRVWDEQGEATALSDVHRFGTALLNDTDWQAEWIGMGAADEPLPDTDRFYASIVQSASNSTDGKLDPETFAGLPADVAAFEPEPRAPMLRREFEVPSAITRARVFVCGLGLFELRLNGEKVGDDVLATSRTDFRKRAMYNTYDVTEALRTGSNAIGLMLGNGWFNGAKKHWNWQMPWFGTPRGMVQLEIDLADGSTQRVVSNGDWRATFGPIAANCIYDGEDYDAQREQAGWDSPGFDASDWANANVVPGPGGRLTALSHEANQVVERIRPVSISEPSPGVYVFDMGKNLTGWAKLKVRGGKAGETVVMRFAEQIHEDGSLNPATAGGARQADHYTMRDADEQHYEPRFTYHGFQYVEVTGYPGTPELDSIEGCFVHAAVEQTGTFECGHPLINRIHQCTLQSQRCNMQMGVVTDDTQRAERLGWCGDIWAMANEANYNFAMPRMWDKWVRDCIDQQDDQGMIGYIVPLNGPSEDLVWSAAFFIVAWLQYEHFGDARLLEDAYPALQRYADYLKATGTKQIEPYSAQELHKRLRWRPEDERYPSPDEHGCLQISKFGDHLATHEGGSGFSKNQPISIATAFYYHDVKLMQRIATVLGKDDDANRYGELATKIQAAYHDRFYVPAFHHYDNGCQSAQAWALAFNIVPDECRKNVAGYLCSAVNFRQRRLTTGYAGTQPTIHALSEAGRDDIIWERAIATDYPSWGFMLRDPNRTTITENWHGAASLCHTVLGAAIDEWFYWGLCGIRRDATAPGFERIVIKPYLPRDLPFARASIRTVRGVITSAWEHDGKTASLSITIPPNCDALVHIPATNPNTIRESGNRITDSQDVEISERSEGQTILAMGSGEYQFTFALPKSG